MKDPSLGSSGEDYVCSYLGSNGYRLLDRNFRNKLGEIDLVMYSDGQVCFIEVKTRSTLAYGPPWEAVHPAKQRKMVLLALSYLKYKFKRTDVPLRFDVVSLYKKADGTYILRHLKNAFDLSYLSH